jgi:WD40 repeat protein/class 3 adenylate cyclase
VPGRVEEGGFAESLRRHRLAAGLTQEGLAERAGLSARGVQDLERGLRRSPHPDTARRLASALGIQLTELMGSSETGGGVASPVPTRGLAVFLAAGLDGYTRYTREHGDEAAAAVAVQLSDLVRQVAEVRGGQLVEARGEQALAIFWSARQALRAAEDVQAQARAGATLSLRVGIGLDAGEPVPVNGGFRGDALNVAAHLCALAQPGQVLASDLVLRLARRVEGLAYEECEPIRLKGVDSPVGLWRIRDAHDAAADAAVDVYLCADNQLGTEVEQVARELEAKGLRPWPAGKPGESGRAEAGHTALSAATTCAVFIERNGLSDWDAGQVGLALGRARRDPSFRLFPVLLPGVREPFDATTLPPELASQPWVDMRGGLDGPDAVRQLVVAIRGSGPVETDQDASVETGEECPYLGLQAYDERHAELFFGRDGDIQRLLEQLKGNRFLAIVAPSGTGKSSLARAGLVPALRRGALATSETWVQQTLTPGPEPLAALAAALLELSSAEAMQPTVDRLESDARTLHLSVSLALARRPAATRLVLLIDQFEEIFTQCYDPREQAQFVANVLYAATVPGGRTIVVLTMRADFYARCAVYPELAACIATHQHLLSPMDEIGLRQIIESPALQAGLRLEPGLAERMLDDVVGEPGALPLLEFALLELWRHRRGNTLTFQGYSAIGGVQGALAQRAETVYGDLSHAEQAIAQRLFLRLIEPGDGTEDSRRRAPMAELITPGAAPDDTERVVTVLADARLLVTAADAQTQERYVEVAHEALIRHWPRLRQWVDDDRAALRTHRRLTEGAREWLRLNREDEALFRGARLAEAMEWGRQHGDDLNALERDFLDASGAFQDRQRRARDHQRKLVTGLLALGLVAALLLGGLAVLQWRQAEDARQVALSQELAFQADTVRTGLPVELPRSVLLAAEALRRAPSSQAERALRSDLALLAKPIASMAHPARVQALAYSPDGHRLATASFDGLARVWDPLNGQQLMALQHAGPVQAIEYSVDGRLLATGSDDGTARIWDAATGEQLLELRHADRVYAVAFSPDGAHLASATRDGNVFIWDTATGQNTAHMADSAPLPAVPYSFSGNTKAEAPGPAIAFSSDGRLVATGWSADAAARVWDVATGRQVAVLQHDGIVQGVAFQPGSNLVATASVDGFVKLWDATTGQNVERLAMDKNFPAYRIAFSPDGRTLAAAGDQFNAKTWEVATGKDLARLPHSDTVQALAFSPDNRTIATAGNESAAHLWDASSGREVGRVAIEGASDVYALEFSPDSRQIAVISDDNRVSVWEATKPWQVSGLQHDGLVYNAEFSPDARYLATGSADGAIRLWDASTGELLRRWDTGGAVYPVRFTADGKYLASASYDGNAYVMDLATGAEVARLPQGEVVFDAAISPSGRLLAAGTASGQVRVWDWRSGQELLHLQHDAGVQGVFFSADERQLATGSLDGTVRVWDLGDGRELLRLIAPGGHQIYSMDMTKDGRYIATGEIGTVRLWDVASGREELQLPHDSLVNGVAFSGDGRLLATAGRDGTVRLFELPSGHELDSMAHALSANGVGFSPDGKLLATASDDRTARVWAVAPGNLLAEACGTVTRNLSTGEWQRYLPDQSYRRTCPDLP